jgi:hypothetical protein
MLHLPKPDEPKPRRQFSQVGIYPDRVHSSQTRWAGTFRAHAGITSACKLGTRNVHTYLALLTLNPIPVHLSVAMTACHRESIVGLGFFLPDADADDFHADLTGPSV